MAVYIHSTVTGAMSQKSFLYSKEFFFLLSIQSRRLYCTVLVVGGKCNFGHFSFLVLAIAVEEWASRCSWCCQSMMEGIA